MRVRLILKPAFSSALFKSESDLSDFMTYKLLLCVVAMVSGKGRRNWVTLRICCVSEQDQPALGEGKKFKPKRTEHVPACWIKSNRRRRWQKSPGGTLLQLLYCRLGLVSLSHVLGHFCAALCSLWALCPRVECIPVLCCWTVLFPDKSLTVGFAVYAVNRSVGPLSVCIAVAALSPNKSL